jgi:hypothetical protein
MSRPPLEHDVVTSNRSGMERTHRYASEEPLRPGDVLRLEGRFWLVEEVDADAEPPRALAKPARYRIQLNHPDGRVELGAVRRYRPDAPHPGHSFTTMEDGEPVSWEIDEERLTRDDEGEPLLELIADRDYGEAEQLPGHELEHTLAARALRLPEAAAELLRRADGTGIAMELVALEPGELPDWDEAGRYIDALILEEIEDDLLVLGGVNPDRDPREHWLEKVKERLRADIDSFRADVEGDHDEIEEWDFLDGRVFAAVGSFEDESDPDAGYGWLSRLVDASATAAAGLRRVRKTELELEE